MAKDIADKYGIEGKRSASLLDIFSCFIQGIIPYGAQILLALGFAGINSTSPLTIMSYSFYPFLTGVCAIIAIIFNIPKSIELSGLVVVYRATYRFIIHKALPKITPGKKK